MADIGRNEGASIFENVRNASSGAEAELQFRSMVGEVDRDTLAAVGDLEHANNLIIDIQENPLNFNSQRLLSTYVNDEVLNCDPTNLFHGMDAYSYGSGKTPELEPDEEMEADYYREHVVLPILQRYGIKEEDLNRIHKEKGKAFWRNFIGVEG